MASIYDNQRLHLQSICDEVYTDSVQAGSNEDRAQYEADVVRTWGEYMMSLGFDVTGVQHIAVVVAWESADTQVFPLVDANVAPTTLQATPSGLPTVGAATRKSADGSNAGSSRRPMVTLEDARTKLPGPVLSLGALRKCRDRDEAFPKARSQSGMALQYDMNELFSWKASRDARRGLRTTA